MNRALVIAFAAATTGLAGGAPRAEAAEPAARGAAATPSTDIAALLPGLGIEQLPPAQREVLARVLESQFCYCGCPHSLLGCLREHKACRHAPRMAALAARLVAGGLPQEEVTKLLDEYYRSFERAKRAHLDTKDFGPLLGKSSAPIAVVEFSDFACPYCQLLRPTLEDFVDEHADRVKLYYKPFPLPSHPHSFEAAEAAEWARDQGMFWPMHDALFAHPHDLAPKDLETYARQLGGDPASLAKALETHRYKPRIETSMAEARAAGLAGTPTLYFEGRRYNIPDYSPAGLAFTLEDEQEWQKNHGAWNRD